MSKCDRCASAETVETINSLRGEYNICLLCQDTLKEFFRYHEYVRSQKRDKNWIVKLINILPSGQIVEVLPDRVSVTHTREAIYHSARKLGKKVVCAIQNDKLYVCAIEERDIKRPFRSIKL